MFHRCIKTNKITDQKFKILHDTFHQQVTKTQPFFENYIFDPLPFRTICSLKNTNSFIRDFHTIKNSLNLLPAAD